MARFAKLSTVPKFPRFLFFAQLAFQPELIATLERSGQVGAVCAVPYGGNLFKFGANLKNQFNQGGGRKLAETS